MVARLLLGSVLRFKKCVATLPKFTLYCSYTNKLGAVLRGAALNYSSLNGIKNAQIY